MATDLVFNDFRSGQIDEQFGYRADLTVYNSSAHKLENVVPMRAGGLTLREGTEIIKDAVEAVRLIDFCVSATEHYIITLELALNELHEYFTRMRIYTLDAEGNYYDISQDGFICPWQTKSQISEIQYAQDYENLILVQKNFPPVILTRKGAGIFAPPSYITLDRTTDRKDEAVDEEGRPIIGPDGKPVMVDFLYDYAGLFEKNDFPTAVTFAANRLIFANSLAHPYRIWVSQPFKYNNFQTEVYYPSVDESVTTEEYLKAIENYTDKVEDLGINPDTQVHEEKRINKTVSIDGWVVITTGIYNKDTGELIGQETKETFNYTKPTIEWKTIITEDCAMILDIASNRNERIAWLGYVGDMIIVGSATSEWAMPAKLSPTSAQITKIASFGSMDYGSAKNGAENVFYVQSGGRRIRSVMNSPQGFGFFEPSYPCEELFKDGIRELHWQRVPEPRLYAVLENGDLAVLSFDPEYGMNAWCRWTTEGKFLSLCVVDTEKGQDVIALVERNSVKSLEVFRKGVYMDHGGDVPFIADIITNCIDTPATMKLTKKIYSVAACAGGTNFKVGQDRERLIVPRNVNQRMVDLNTWNRPTDQGLRIEVNSIPGERFVLHSLIVTTEVVE